MTLSELVETYEKRERGELLRELSRETNIPYFTMKKYRVGAFRPSIARCLQLQKATLNKVTVYDYYPELREA